MADWPPTLPQTALQNGYGDTQRDNVLRSPMGYGPAKTRRQVTTVIRDGTRAFVLTDAQKATLDAFYESDGALVWTWDEGAGVQNYRFRAAPRYRPVSCDQWSAAVQVEIVP
jgi:hypothetical protein